MWDITSFYNFITDEAIDLTHTLTSLLLTLLTAFPWEQVDSNEVQLQCLQTPNHRYPQLCLKGGWRGGGGPSAADRGFGSRRHEPTQAAAGQTSE